MQQRPDSVMLFAAGRGTRMGPLTKATPKPLIQVAGKPLLDHALDQVAAINPRRVVVNTHYLGAQISDHLAGRAGVRISDETDQLLETGGGLRAALPLLGDGPVVTLNSDAVWAGPSPLTTLMDTWDGDKMDALLLLVPCQNARAHTGPGDFDLLPDGGITRRGDYVYTGAQIIKTAGLKAIPETAFSLNLLWDSMLMDERIYGVVHTGGWCDVGHPDGIAIAEKMLRDA